MAAWIPTPRSGNLIQTFSTGEPLQRLPGFVLVFGAGRNSDSRAGYPGHTARRAAWKVRDVPVVMHLGAEIDEVPRPILIHRDAASVELLAIPVRIARIGDRRTNFLFIEQVRIELDSGHRFRIR